MKVKFIVFGKLKDKAYTNLVDHYLNNLNHFIESEIIELKDLPDPKIINQTTIDQLLQQESLQLQKYCTKKDYVIVCNSHGQQLDSIGYANLIQKSIAQPQYQNIVIIIGSSNGLAQSIKDQAHYLLSFGKMTYPHNLMRVMLLEQTYRAFSIINHRSYHK